ncbi:MAG: hypothetical protein JWP11_35 [Frankiales bacterium]|nr:hypothetical protein [Frankiales bacterium]
MPGVTVDTSTRPGPGSSFAPDSGQYFVAGMTERGSATGYEVVTSLGEYVDKCGGETTFGFLYGDLKRFFAKGGSRALIARAVGPAASVGTNTSVDRAGAPVATLRYDAANPGAWAATHMTRQVLAGSNTGTFKVVIAYDGAIVESKDNLVTPADAVTAFATSPYARVTNLSSVTAAPANQPAIDGAPVAFTGGADDRASVTATMVAAALGRFPKDLGPGAVAIPGYAADVAITGGTIGQALKDHANANRRDAGLAPAKGTSISAVQALSDTLDGADGSGSILLYPWVEANGPGSPLVSPEGIWAGLRATAHRLVGPWGVPAGEAGEVDFISGLEVELTRAQADQLDAAKVSVFRKIRQNGSNSYRLYGYRSLSTDVDNYPLLKTRSLLNYLEAALENDLETYVFQTIDSRGFLAVEAAARITTRLEAIYRAGGLSDYLDPATSTYVPGTAYRVDTGPAVNTPDVRGRNEFDAYVGVRDSAVAAELKVHIAKVALAAAV